jgi:hypothetical protein
MYVAKGTYKMTFSEPGSLTVISEVRYTLPPDDGLLMPETYRGILIQ